MTWSPNGNNPQSTQGRTSLPATTNGFPNNSFDEARERAILERQRFPYRFPRDPRHIGGLFSVKKNAERLLRFFYFERRLMQAIGAWTLAIPEFEVKLECGRHIFYHADAARTLRERLSEQELKFDTVDRYRHDDIDRFIEELLLAADTPEFLVGLHWVAGQALQVAYQHHIDRTDSVTDAPTIRALKRILVDYEPMLSWADAAIEAYIQGGVEESRLSAWRWHLHRFLASIGGVTGGDERTPEPAGLRSREKAFERCTEPKRDERFTTFKNTGVYEVGDGQPRFDKDSYDAIRLRFVRTQRDEVDAIEAFGTFLWDIRFRDFQAEYDLARITWDECRHTEIGHKSLLTMGYDPFELPNRLTGSTCRGPMEPSFAMAEINLFGEVGVLKTINGFIDEARDKNDMLLEHIADFIRSDERTHVRKGQHILKVMTDMGAKDLELRTRELFTECLVSLGAITKDMDLFTVSREDIEELVGE